MSDRRTFLKYTGVSLLTTLTTATLPTAAQTPPTLTIQWLGHTCFLFTGNNKKILLNPFKPGGCTKGYRPIKAKVDLVIVSSLLLDEGSVADLPGNPPLLYEPGRFDFDKMIIQSIKINKDREGGRRFGTNLIWTWTQAGIKIAHLGATPTLVEIEQQILLGRPDLALIPVGGGDKAYTPAEAIQVINFLKPRVVIPTHYRTQAADPNACDLVALDEFLTLAQDLKVNRNNSDTIILSKNKLPSSSLVEILTYKF